MSQQPRFCYLKLAHNGKKPIQTDWPNSQLTDPLQIDLARYNLGIVTGDGFIVIDVDYQKPEAQASFARYKHLLPSATRIVSTPSGGFHLYYLASPDQLERFAIKTCSGIAPGIDVRAKGGCVAAPPSRTSAGAYTITSDAPLAPFPTAFFEALEAPPRQAASTTNSLITGTGRSCSTMPESIPAGERDDVINSFAFYWRQQGKPQDEATALMKELHSRCEQPADNRFSLEQALAKVEREYAKPLDSVAPSTSNSDEMFQHIWPERFVDALDRFIFIEEGEEVADKTRRSRETMKLQTFKNIYAGKKFNQIKMSTLWLSSKDKIIARAKTYYPKDVLLHIENGEQFYNIYRATSLEPAEKIDQAKIRPFIEHLQYLFPDPADLKLFLQWFLYTIKVPYKKIQWAPFIISKPGVGKGLLIQVMELLMGRTNVSVVPDTVMDTNFRKIFAETTLMVFDDVEKGKDNDLAKSLKPYITDSTMLIEQKHKDPRNRSLYCNILLLSNNPYHAIRIEDNDRRFWVYQVEQDAKEQAYYDRLFAWLETDGPAHLLAWVLAQPIKDFNPGLAPPMTKAKREMIKNSKPLYEALIEEAIEDATGVFKHDILTSDLVQAHFERTGKQLGVREIGHLRHAFAHCTHKLPQSQYNTHSGVKRLRCVRNMERWCEASREDIVEEFERALVPNGVI